MSRRVITGAIVRCNSLGAFVVAWAVLSGSAAHALTWTWIGPPGEQNWSVAENWRDESSNNTVPISGDTTVLSFSNTGTDTIVAVHDMGVFTLNALQLDNRDAGHFDVIDSAGGTLTFAGTAPTIQQSGVGAYYIAAQATLNPTMTFAGAGTGEVRFTGGAILGGVTDPSMTQTIIQNSVAPVIFDHPSVAVGFAQNMVFAGSGSGAITFRGAGAANLSTITQNGTAEVNIGNTALTNNLIFGGTGSGSVNFTGTVTGLDVFNALTQNGTAAVNFAQAATLSGTTVFLGTGSGAIRFNGGVTLPALGPVGLTQNSSAPITIAGTTMLNDNLSIAGTGSGQVTLENIEDAGNARVLTVNMPGTVAISGTANLGATSTYTVRTGGLTPGLTAASVLSIRSPGGFGSGLIDLSNQTSLGGTADTATILEIGATDPTALPGTDFSRTLGAAAGNINMTTDDDNLLAIGAGVGFAARGARRVVMLQTAQPGNVYKITDPFAINRNVPLTFGSATSDNQIVFQNDIDLTSGANGTDRRFRTIHGSSPVPEVNLTGVIKNTAGTGGTLVFDGTGGIIISNRNNSFSMVETPMVVSSGNLFLAADDMANGGSALGVAANQFSIGDANSAGSPIGFMTYGPGGGITPAPSITVGRDVTVTANGTGTITLGGATADKTAFTGSLLLNRSVHIQAVSGGEFDYLPAAGKALSGPGGITKMGQGTAVLGPQPGAYIYGGQTVVSEGTLLINGDLMSTSGVDVSPAATLGGSGSIFAIGSLNMVTVSPGGILAPHVAPTALSTLTVNGSMTLDGVVLDFNAGPADLSDQVNAAGLLTLSGTTTLNVHAAPGFSGGRFKILGYGSLAGAGNLVLGTRPGGPRTYALDFGTAGEIDLVVTLLSKTWTGTVNGNWFTGGTDMNWTDHGGSPATFAAGDPVRFDDGADGVGPVSVNISDASVAPFDVTVSNPTREYTIGGGKITGTTNLTKSGDARLILTGANDYVGDNVVAGGALSVSADNNLGNAANAVTLYGTGSTLEATAGFTTNRVVNLAGGGSIAVTGSNNLIAAGRITGAGGLTKTGTGTLTLTDPANDFSDGVDLRAGVLAVSSDGHLGTAGGGLRFNGGLLSIDTASAAFDSGRNISLGAVGGTLQISGDKGAIFRGTVAGGNALNLDVTAPVTFLGQVQASGTMSINGGTTNFANVTAGATSNNLAGAAITVGPSATLAGNITIDSRSSLEGAAINLAGGTLRIGSPPGLYEGTLAGNRNLAGTPASWLIASGARAGYMGGATGAQFPWGDNATIVYSGQFYWAGSATNQISFGENIDDSFDIKVDGKDPAGNYQFAGNATWNVPTAYTYTLVPGWHSIEVRFANGTGGWGGAIGTGWDYTFGFGYDDQGRASTDGTYYKRFEDSGDGSFLRAMPLGGSVGLADAILGNDVTVFATSEVAVPGNTNALFGNLTLAAPGATLRGPAAGSGIAFAGTSAQSPGTYTFDAAGQVSLGAVNDSGFDVTFSKVGGGDLILSTTTPAAVLGGGSSFQVGAGCMIVVGSAAENNPLGSAGIVLDGADTTLVLSGKTMASVALDNRVTVNQNATISAAAAGGGVASGTIALGSGAKGVSVAPDKNLTLSVANSYTLNIVGPLTASGDLVVKGAGTVMLGGGATWTTGKTLDLQTAALRLGPGITMAPGSLKMAGGASLLIDAGSSVDLPGSGVEIPANTGARTVIDGSGTLNFSGSAYTFDVLDGPNNFDLVVGARLLGAGAPVLKIGPGTLVLSGTSDSDGGITVNQGTLAIDSDAALGASGSGVTLNDGTTLKVLTTRSVLPALTTTIAATRPIIINGNGTIDVSFDDLFNVNTVTIAGAIAGGGTLTKAGGGTLYLGAANALGGVNVNAGTLWTLHAGALGGNVPISVARGAALEIGAGSTGINLTGLSAANGGTVRLRADPGAGSAGPTSDFLGTFDQNNVAMNSGFALRFGPRSTFQIRGQTLTNPITLNGDTLVAHWTNNANIDTRIAGAGAYIMQGDRSVTVRNPQDYTGATMMDSTGNYWLYNSGTLASTTLIGYRGNFQPDDSGTNNALGASRFVADATFYGYGGWFTEKGKDGVAADETLANYVMMGASGIRAQRTNATATTELIITTLTRNPGTTVMFQGIDGAGANLALGAAGTNPRILLGNGAALLSATAITSWASANGGIDWALYDATNGVAPFTAYTTAWPAAGGSTTADMSIAADQTVDAASVVPTINSLKLGGTTSGATYTLAINSDLTITSGGLLGYTAATTAPTWTISGAGKLQTPGGAELIINNNNQFTISAPLNVGRLTKSGAGALILNNEANVITGPIQMNWGTLQAIFTTNPVAASGPLGPTGMGAAQPITIAGFGNILQLRANTGSSNFDYDLYNPINVTNWGSISADRSTTAGGNHLFKLGPLDIAYGRTLDAGTGNNCAVSFTGTTLHGWATINFNNGSNNAYARAYALGNVDMGGNPTPGQADSGGQLNLKVVNGATVKIEELSGVGDLVKTDLGTVYINQGTSTTNPYSGAVHLTGGSLRLQNPAFTSALGDNPVAVYNRTWLDLGPNGQTPMPTVSVQPYGAVGGNLGPDPVIFGGGANAVTLPATDAVIVQGVSVEPTAAQRGLAVDWLGITNSLGNQSIDPAASIYRGIAFGFYTTANFNADLATASGDLNILVQSTRKIQPSSAGAVQNISPASGVVNVFGPSELQWSANGGNGPQGAYSVINRYGDGTTQNSWLLTFYDTAGALRAGKVANIWNGRLGVVSVNTTVANGAVVNVNTNATLYLDNQAPTTGTFNVASDGIVYTTTLNKVRGGATFTFSPGTRFVLNGDTGTIDAASFAGQDEKLDYIIARDNDACDVFFSSDGQGFKLGEGRRIATGWNQNARLGKRTAGTLGHGFTWATGATNILITAAAGRTFYVNDQITVPDAKVIQVGDARPFVTVSGDTDVTSRQVNQDGAVEFDLLNVEAGGTVSLINGTMRLMENVASGFVITGTIDDGIPKPADFQGTGPLFQIRTGRDGVEAKFVTGTGEVRLGQGEDIQIMIDEVVGISSTNPTKMNEFRAGIRVLDAALGTGTTAPAVSGHIRAIRGSDQNSDYAVGRFTSVRMDQGAILGLARNDGGAILVDPVLYGDAQILALTGATGRMTVGNVGTQTGETVTRTLTIGQNTGDNVIDLVGTLSGLANVRLNSSATIRMIGQSLQSNANANTLAPSAFFTTFNLGGRKVELQGSAVTEVWVDPGAGTIQHDSTTAGELRIYAGKAGTPSFTAATVIDVGNDRIIRGYADEVATASGALKVNQIDATINVLNSGTASARLFADRGIDSNSNFSWVRFTKVQPAEGATARLERSNAQALMADFNLVANGTVLSNNNADRYAVGDVNGGGGYKLTVGGANAIRLVGAISNGATLEVTNTANTTVTTTGKLALAWAMAYNDPFAKSFNLNGQTLRINGTGLTTIDTDLGSGTLDLAAGRLTINTPSNIDRFIFRSGTFTPNNSLTINKGGYLAGNAAISDLQMNQIIRQAGTSPSDPGAGIAPGGGNCSVGTITLGSGGGLTTPDYSVYYWDYGGAAEPHDQIAVNGGVVFGANPILQAAPLGFDDPAAQEFTILTWTGADPVVQPAWTVDTTTTRSTSAAWDGLGDNTTWDDLGNFYNPGFTGGTVTYVDADGTSPGGSLRLSGLGLTALKPAVIQGASAVSIAPANDITITGPAAATSIESLVLGGGAGNPTLSLSTGALRVAGLADIKAGAVLNANGDFSAGSLTSAGTFTVAAAKTASITGAVTVSGLLTADGTLKAGAFNSSGTSTFRTGGSLGVAAAPVASATVSGGTTEFQSGAGAYVTTFNASDGATYFRSGSAGTVGILNVAGGSVDASGPSFPEINVTSGTLNTDSAAMGVLKVTGGSVTVTGATARVTTADLSAAGAGMVNAAIPLTVTDTLKLPGGHLVTLTGAPSFTAAGADLANNDAARTLTLGGGSLSLAASPSIAPITIVDAPVATPWQPAAGAWSQQFTVSPDSNVLVVAMGNRDANPLPASLQWNGVNMTKAVQRSSDGTVRNVAIYYLYNPVAGTFDFTGALTGDNFVVNAFTIDGVDMSAAPKTGSYFAGGNQNPVSTTITGIAEGSFAVATEPTNLDVNTPGPWQSFGFTATVSGEASGTPQPLWSGSTSATAVGVGTISGLTAGDNVITGTIYGVGGGVATGNCVRSALAAAVFAPTVGPAQAVNLPGTNIHVAASSTLKLGNSVLDHTLGDLTIADGATLGVQDARTVSFNRLVGSGAAAIDIGVPIQLRLGEVEVPTGILRVNAPLAGPAGLTKLGLGTLLLDAVNTYAGDTLVSEGTLGGAGAIAGPVTVATGARLAPGGATGIGALTVGSLALQSGSYLDYRFGPGANDQTIIPAGTLAFPAGENVTLNISEIGVMPAGSYDLFRVSGAVSQISGFAGGNGSTGSILLGTHPAEFNYLFSTFHDDALNLSYVRMMASIGPVNVLGVWTGANSGSWASGGNWQGGQFPNDVGHTATFGAPGVGRLGVTLDESKKVSEMTFESDASGDANVDYTVAEGTGGSLILEKSGDNALLKVTAGQHMISAPVTLNSSTTVDIVGAGSALEIAGDITGEGKDLATTGDGLLVLSGTNNHYGDTTVDGGGTLRIDQPGALPPGGSLTISDGTVQLRADLGQAIDLGGLTITLSAPAPVGAPVAQVPEPATLVLLVVAVAAGLVIWLGRRRSSGK